MFKKAIKKLELNETNAKKLSVVLAIALLALSILPKKAE